ncbi:polysaccharide pyruvyl transferase family protein [Noviherbaspirillum sp.]|uniref:polysaccharide pyruvyl transferase family protein n=1 Tax=Noviherbaspirillum sp. TaxID=1926288 RepID=UPI002FE39C1D
MTSRRTTSVPVIVFGAFDRHNFGDLLFPHIAAALLGERQLIFAGLASRDLRAAGGHLVMAISELALQYRNRQVNILHAGGELLTCNAWEAAVMLQHPDEARQAALQCGPNVAQRMQWAQARLGLRALVPYSASRDLFPQARICYAAVGGANLDALDPAMHAEVCANLSAADMVSVRERHTQALLEDAGISSLLLPDPAVMVAKLFGATIHARPPGNDVAAVRDSFPAGYLAIQFSEDFSDDTSLAIIAAQLDAIAESTGYGIVFFRAGAAPWHDDLACYRRTAAHMRRTAYVFESLHLWDICALVAGSQAYCGSSLHGRIVAGAFAVPRVTLRPPAQGDRPGKHASYASTWEVPGMPSTVDVKGIANGIAQAMSVDPILLQESSANLAKQYEDSFKKVSAALM